MSPSTVFNNYTPSYPLQTKKVCHYGARAGSGGAQLQPPYSKILIVVIFWALQAITDCTSPCWSSNDFFFIIGLLLSETRVSVLGFGLLVERVWGGGQGGHHGTSTTKSKGISVLVQLPPVGNYPGR